MNICADILQNIENRPNFLGNVITCDESWFFQYDPGTKSPTSPKKKAWKSKSNLKAMMMIPPPISEGLFTLIGCLKVRLLTRSAIRRV
jgi:hypothetical protein